MTKPVVISLCDESGIMVEDWAIAGFECYCIDIAHRVRSVSTRGNIRFVFGDIRSWYLPDGLAPHLAIMFGFPPCTDTSVSGARDFFRKGPYRLSDALELFAACRLAMSYSGVPWMIEQPVTVLPSHVGEPDHRFDPCDYGDSYTKKTCLWTGGGFVMPPKRPVEPVEGSKMHMLPPSSARARLRAQTPRGFARAVFEANAPLVKRAVA